jgi:hypothetical protein
LRFTTNSEQAVQPRRQGLVDDGVHVGCPLRHALDGALQHLAFVIPHRETLGEADDGSRVR